MVKNIPNFLTVIRIILTFMFLFIFFSGHQNANLYAAFIFLFAQFTDVLDGYIARKYNLISDFGKLMDPFADKLMQFFVSASIAIKDETRIMWWIVGFIFLKEIAMLLGTTYMLNKNIVVSANVWGKISSLIYFVVFLIILLFNHIAITTKFILAFIFVFFSTVSFVIYIVQGRRILIKGQKT